MFYQDLKKMFMLLLSFHISLLAMKIWKLPVAQFLPVKPGAHVQSSGCSMFPPHVPGKQRYPSCHEHAPITTDIQFIKEEKVVPHQQTYN
jgi:hypothetical protein